MPLGIVTSSRSASSALLSIRSCKGMTSSSQAMTTMILNSKPLAKCIKLMATEASSTPTLSPAPLSRHRGVRFQAQGGVGTVGNLRVERDAGWADALRPQQCRSGDAAALYEDGSGSLRISFAEELYCFRPAADPVELIRVIEGLIALHLIEQTHAAESAGQSARHGIWGSGAASPHNINTVGVVAKRHADLFGYAPTHVWPLFWSMTFKGSSSGLRLYGCHRGHRSFVVDARDDPALSPRHSRWGLHLSCRQAFQAFSVLPARNNYPTLFLPRICRRGCARLRSWPTARPEKRLPAGFGQFLWAH